MGPCRPKPTKNPKSPILDSQPRTRIFSLEYAQLLMEGEDLEAEVVAGTEKGAEQVRKPTKNGIMGWDL
jgi:hypothetical protein